MPGPGTADRPAAARLREGLDGWRRHVARRQSAAAARLWSLITLGAALAGVAAGRLDGSVLVTAVSFASLSLAAGAVSVVRSRRVSAGDAARLLDAAFGLDEQVATALCFAGTGAAAGAEAHPLVTELIERAAGLVAQTGGVPGPRPVPAYGEWAAMAVTAAAVAAVAAVPVPPPAARTVTATGGLGRVSSVSSASGAAATPAGTGSRANGVSSAAGASPAGRATHGGTGTSGARTAPAGGTGARAPAPGTPSPPESGTGRSGGTRAGETRTSGAGASGVQAGRSATVPRSPATAGVQGADGGHPAAAPAAGSGPHGPARSAAGQSGKAQPGSAFQPGSRAQPGSGARGGVPGGETAGTRPGNDRTRNGPARLLPGAGNRVLLIVLPGGEGGVAAAGKPGTPGSRPEGNGGTAAATGIPAGAASGAGYLPPDGNEVPFPDQGLLGRYF